MPACMQAYCLCCWCLPRPQEGVISPEIRVKLLSAEVWMLGIEPLALWRSTLVFLTVEPSLHPTPSRFITKLEDDWKQVSLPFPA